MIETGQTLLQETFQRIRSRRYGVIEAVGGSPLAIRFRSWPKLVSGAETRWWNFWRGGNAPPDHCRLYWSQPLSAPRFLTVNYVRSSWQTTYATFLAAVQVLDAVAWIKNSDAMVCEAFNRRISDRLLQRWGWERHLANSRRRHYIKRFYGDWTAVQPALKRMGLDTASAACSRPAVAASGTGLEAVPASTAPPAGLGFTQFSSPASLRAGSGDSAPV